MRNIQASEVIELGCIDLVFTNNQEKILKQSSEFLRRNTILATVFKTV